MNTQQIKQGTDLLIKEVERFDARLNEFLSKINKIAQNGFSEVSDQNKILDLCDKLQMDYMDVADIYEILKDLIQQQKTYCE